MNKNFGSLLTIHKLQLHERSIRYTYIILEIYIDFDFHTQSTLLGIEGLRVDTGGERKVIARDDV